LALTVYGDLDVSVIDEMPPGRTPIKTKRFPPTDRERLYGFVRRQVHQGRQAYIIYPLVEESEVLDVGAAVDAHARLTEEIFPDLRVGLLHGRLKGAEKDEVMRSFAGGDLDILVSTSVVEVGVDVPNATLMLIEDAERFGLAQLHQFRGRVGRGEHESYCALFSRVKGGAQHERLNALAKTTDGFILAEKDLELRGPGDFLGTRQSGLPDLKMANLSDTATLHLAQEAAQDLLRQDPDLDNYPLVQEKVEQFWRGHGDVS
jgi:ATP-dependent DNA helicase RecG